MPTRPVAQQNSQKFAWYSASTPSRVPAVPSIVPKMKPVRRPTRPISIAAGMVISAVPATTAVTGRVASALSSARLNPISPPSAIMIAEVDVNSA